MSEQQLSSAKRALLEKWLKGQQPMSQAPGIPKRPAGSPITLSYPQQRQLFLELLEPGTAVNNLSVLIRLDGSLHLPAFQQSFKEILHRHEVLRTRFSLDSGTPTPELAQDVRSVVPIVDLQGMPGDDALLEARRMSEIEVLRPFDLGQAPLIRLLLYKLGQDRHVLLVVSHHIITDGWSLGVFVGDLMAYYESHSTGRPSSVTDLPLQYFDYAHWQTGEQQRASHQPSLEYWKAQLSGELPVLELATDSPRGARQTFAGGTHRFVLSAELTLKLEKMARSEDATLYMVLLTAFSILLHRFSGQSEIMIGTPVANRNRQEWESLIGVFINTLVLRTEIAGDQGFIHLLQHVRKVTTEALAHQDLPFEKLVEELRPKRDLSRTPLFQVVFNLLSSPLPALQMGGLTGQFLDLDRGVSQFDLTLMVSKRDGECHAAVEYNSDLFRQETIAGMCEAFQMIVKAALAQPGLPVSQLPIAAPSVIHRLVYERNQTAIAYPRDRHMHLLFEQQAAASPDAIALIHGDMELRYADLNRQADAVASHLHHLGAGPGSRVCILMKRSLEMVVALLGVHKAGCTYVPVHTSFPLDRVKFILQDADVKVLITNAGTELPEVDGLHVLHLNPDGDWSQATERRPELPIHPEDLAYIIYTSGSTGTPKGVMVYHSSLVNFLWSMRECPGISAADRLLAVTSISFDIAALELYLPLLVGATVVIASEDMTTHPQSLREALDRFQVSMMQATPAMWQLLLETDWVGKPGFKALCGGDALSRSLADRILERVDSLWNMYGPTETTIWSAVSEVHRDGSPITIGRGIANTQLYVLDSYMQPLPHRVVGELHIGGEGLASGYLNLPGLTADRFIPDRFSDSPGARLYKTGDRARYLPDDTIEVLGRMDDQLKINGNRLELGEISAVLKAHPSVNDAVVIARTETSGDKRLIAYFVSRSSTPPEAAELREHVRKKLPPYMIPAFFIPIPSLPLNASGKVDRKSLPLPEDVRPTLRYAPPQTEQEKILVEIWQNVLGVEQVGVHDNFFDLGGASIQSLQIIAKANMYGFNIRVEDIFEFQTIAELAAERGFRV